MDHATKKAQGRGTDVGRDPVGKALGEARLDRFASAFRDRPESPEWEGIARHLSGAKVCACDESHALARAVTALLEARDGWAAATRAARKETATLRLEALRLASRVARGEVGVAGSTANAEVVYALETLAAMLAANGGAR